MIFILDMFKISGVDVYNDLIKCIIKQFDK